MALLQEPEQSETEAIRGPFAMDNLLRKNGFHVYSRKPPEVRWQKAGVILTQSQALLEVDWKDVQEAELAEKAYCAKRKETKG